VFEGQEKANAVAAVVHKQIDEPQPEPPKEATTEIREEKV
jgi:hypothetical protein